jgi:hypothetical protein
MCEVQYAARVFALGSLGVRVQALNRSDGIIQRIRLIVNTLLEGLRPDPFGGESAEVRNNQLSAAGVSSLHL